ncbi:hypothetical protein CFP56_040302 [Quercus suber]|uniref:Disease resistance protein At4g27190-like leucine-rich repeats domain-containing protein n=1 Tax=Quercus suber TaxID=58331 RepID=A0AAW0LP07_QUESU
MHWGSLIEVDIDTPNLCKFQYCGRNVIPFSSNALALSEVTYQMLKPPIDIAPWNVEKIEFLTKLGKSKQLTLTSTSAKDLVIPKKLRDSLPSPSYNVKQLKVETSHPRTGQEIVELVDSLLWISPLPEILIIRHRINMEPWMTFKCYYCFALFQFSYEKPIIEGEKPSCCKFLPIPCWRHCLKSVMIENFRLSADEETQKADEESLEKYFHENTESLESFQFLSSGIASYRMFLDVLMLATGIICPELDHLSHLTGLHICIENAKILPNAVVFERFESYRIAIGSAWIEDETSETSRILKLNISFRSDDGYKVLFRKCETLILDEMKGVKNNLYELDLESFQSLKHLTVQHNDKIQYIFESMGVLDFVFPSLESITLWNVNNLEWICYMRLPTKTFCNLRVVKVRTCCKLEFVFSSYMGECFSHLQEIYIEDCKIMSAIVAIEREEEIEVDSDDSIMFANLHSLKLRNLFKLEGFLSVVDSLVLLNGKVVFPNLE